jgi:hypothetical protein
MSTYIIAVAFGAWAAGSTSGKFARQKRAEEMRKKIGNN